MDPDRPAALLTQAQREYLQGEKEYEPGTEREIRSRIRSRIRASIEDLRQVTEAGAQEKIDIEDALDPEENAPPMWALPALLFLWTKNNTGGAVQVFSDADESLEDEIDQRAALFDRQVRQGVETVLDFDPPEGIVYDVQNTLNIELGPAPEEIPREDIAALPRSVIDKLLRRGKLTEEEYGEVVKERFDRIERGELNPRPPVGSINLDDVDDLESYLDHAVRSRERRQPDSSEK